MLSCRQFMSKCSVHFDWNTFFCNNHPALITQMICYQNAPFSAPTSTCDQLRQQTVALAVTTRRINIRPNTVSYHKERIASVLFGAHGYDPVHPAYNPYFSACFFSRNSVFLSQQISHQCFSAGLSAQPNGANGLGCAQKKGLAS
jgi:hypothetical protein